jgi:hypothetical protein
MMYPLYQQTEYCAGKQQYDRLQGAGQIWLAQQAARGQVAQLVASLTTGLIFIAAFILLL